ncbi:MAG TPA: hypothetical protein VMW72_20075 [Sedimentisphaerales bacterium]|nr:hypothetical protein [Sedimentisphaerales bacterium]
MEQGLQAKVPVGAKVWVEVEVEAEWVDHLQRVQVEVVYAPTVGKESLMLRDSLVMQ